MILILSQTRRPFVFGIFTSFLTCLIGGSFALAPILQRPSIGIPSQHSQPRCHHHLYPSRWTIIPIKTTKLWLWKRSKHVIKEENEQVLSQPTTTNNSTKSHFDLFREFVQFLQTQQDVIIYDIENESFMERNSGVTFSNDTWGIFADTDETSTSTTTKSGGRTRVLQGGRIIEKGACSLTVIEQGILTAERAANIRARTSSNNHPTMSIQAGDSYSAAALSMVLHSRSPFVPTFRSDVRVFMVQSSSQTTTRKKKIRFFQKRKKNQDDDDTTTTSTMAWFGGGADLTPYYLFPEDITSFHQQYRDLCNRYFDDNDHDHSFGYTAMKKACDDYFYLPARQEHRGTGGIFFDDLPMNPQSMEFVQAVARLWMPSWFPIVQRRSNTLYTEQQKYWQKIRRGRYLEFNLLYDRGVKFGLFTPNPRVEGVMVSAPPEIAYPYNHVVAPGSPEAQLVEVLKTPRSWVD